MSINTWECPHKDIFYRFFLRTARFNDFESDMTLLMKKPVINARELNGWKHLGIVLIHHEDETTKKKK